jgi:acetyl-CoA carboxylase biotin carboxyl carrier protein
MTAKKKAAKKARGKTKAVKPELAIVEDIIDVMDRAGLVEFKLERKGLAISLRRNEGGAAAPAPVPVAAAVASAEPVKEKRPSNLVPITAPMVGTFYRSPSPDSDPFIEEGNDIKPESVVCIVEAMKLMNEIKAEVSGRIVKICLENGQAVEYGQEMFLVEKK